ncbi:hypothetical protein [Pedobacter cryoconitis]|uniref:Uncharacterized protein n=1 Tax=Pedobacter cryoconitis TaxID=188932 RepID=A0A7X0MKQ2_9SPHI|nr:hypothetical protein [Pedobacter cryoconitis]MBB6500688.1 hypothetical protein [Pedobacter cryoconitis]
MLDFYLIPDHQRQPGYPEEVELELAGELDYKTFGNLQKSGIIGSNYDYYTDFRWDTDIIKQICHKINLNQRLHHGDIENLLAILNKARSLNMGLLAYAD